MQLAESLPDSGDTSGDYNLAGNLDYLMETKHGMELAVEITSRADSLRIWKHKISNGVQKQLLNETLKLIETDPTNAHLGSLISVVRNVKEVAKKLVERGEIQVKQPKDCGELVLELEGMQPNLSVFLMLHHFGPYASMPMDPSAWKDSVKMFGLVMRASRYHSCSMREFELPELDTATILEFSKFCRDDLKSSVHSACVGY